METPATMLQIFNDVIVPTLVSALLGLLATLLFKANAWLRTKLGLSSVDFATTKLDSVIPAIVAEADTTIVAGLRAASSDGRITPEEGKAVLDKVIERVRAQLGEAGFADVRKHLGVDAETLLAIIRTRIEAVLDSRKRELTSIIATATEGAAAAAIVVPATEPEIPRSLSPDNAAR